MEKCPLTHYIRVADTYIFVIQYTVVVEPQKNSQVHVSYLVLQVLHNVLVFMQGLTILEIT